MKASTYEYKSDFARRYFSAGKAEGTAEGEVGEHDRLDFRKLALPSGWVG